MYGDVKVIPPLLGAWSSIPYYESAMHWKEDVAQLKAIARVYEWDFAIGFLMKEMRQPRKTVLISDTDKTILYASRYFEIMTGYRREEVFGKKPDFLQGPGTDKKAVQRISHALGVPEKVVSTLVNYKKDGTPYFCNIEIFPIFNCRQQLTNFLAVEEEAEF